ncbi:MAG: hypothetical protein JWN72_746, partial [Thermoleophilia bacterium]|nr:hypothetical protein [Thermoleophilia bacterium]
MSMPVSAVPVGPKLLPWVVGAAVVGGAAIAVGALVHHNNVKDDMTTEAPGPNPPTGELPTAGPAPTPTPGEAPYGGPAVDYAPIGENQADRDAAATGNHSFIAPTATSPGDDYGSGYGTGTSPGDDYGYGGYNSNYTQIYNAVYDVAPSSWGVNDVANVASAASSAGRSAYQATQMVREVYNSTPYDWSSTQEARVAAEALTVGRSAYDTGNVIDQVEVGTPYNWSNASDVRLTIAALDGHVASSNVDD